MQILHYQRALADPKTATDEGFPYWFPPQLRVTPNKYLEFLGGEGGKPLENNAGTPNSVISYAVAGTHGALSPTPFPVLTESCCGMSGTELWGMELRDVWYLRVGMVVRYAAMHLIRYVWC